MAARTQLKNRLPAIMAEMPVEVSKALHIGAELVAAEAKDRVPVNTGRLRDAIHVDEQSGNYMVVAGDNVAFYGHMVEHGTTTAPAHPFLVPSLEMMREVIENLVRRELKGL